MYIHTVSRYLPEQVVNNDYFFELTGLTNDWIVSRTGMLERRKAGVGENTNTMAVAAAEAALADSPFAKDAIDLIVGATYTPHDTIVSHAHQVQHALDIHDIPVVSISSACSSLLNAIEVVQGYFAMSKARRALVVVAEHNTAYIDATDKKSGHLWGDGAAALIISNTQQRETDLKVLDLMTAGAATVGKALDGVMLRPLNGGVKMLNGRDVFIHACTYMAKTSLDILQRNGFGLEDLTFFIPHQANYRITKHVAEDLGIPDEKVISNLQYLGNTGCAGCAIGLSETWNALSRDDLVVVSVFGGGYSYGAMLLQRC